MTRNDQHDSACANQPASSAPKMPSRHSWILPAFVFYILIPAVTLFAVTMLFNARSWDAGMEPLIWAIYTVFMFPALAAGLTVSKSPDPALRRASVLLLVFLLIAPIITCETWFGYEEIAFKREAANAPKLPYSRARWKPFRSSYLVYDEHGRFYGGD